MVTGGERERNWDGMTLLRLGWAGWFPPPSPFSLAKFIGENDIVLFWRTRLAPSPSFFHRC